MKKSLLTVAAAADTLTPVLSAISALWTLPYVIAPGKLIAGAVKAEQFLISQGLALAIPAWPKTLLELAVEAVIASDAGKDPEKIHLLAANFTGHGGSWSRRIVTRISKTSNGFQDQSSRFPAASAIR